MESIEQAPTRIDRHMTAAPMCVHSDTLVGEARELMRDRGVAHAPMLDGRGALVGVVSEHELHAPGVQSSMSVSQIANTAPLVVKPDAPVLEVVGAMARHSTRCALVAQGASLLGIFTLSDALAAVLRVHPVPLDSPPHGPTCDRWGHVIVRE
jgi:CBS domain-containing protein